MIVQDVSHLVNDSGDCAQQLSELTLVPLAPGKATFTWEEAARAIERSAPGPRARAGRGDLDRVARAAAARRDLRLRRDAPRSAPRPARSGSASTSTGRGSSSRCAYSGRPPAEYAALFDTVYVSLWKCFNAGGGAILAGPAKPLADMYHVRRMFGGALWNAWPYAAVAAPLRRRLPGAAVGRRSRVSEDAIRLLSAEPRIAIERVPNGTSLFRLTPRTGDLAAYRARLRGKGSRRAARRTTAASGSRSTSRCARSRRTRWPPPSPRLSDESPVRKSREPFSATRVTGCEGEGLCEECCARVSC